MLKNLLFTLVLLMLHLVACSEYQITPRLSFTAELAPQSEGSLEEKVILLKDFNSLPEDPVKVQGIWVDGVRINEFTTTQHGTYLEIRFLLPRDGEMREIEVGASSQQLALNFEKITIE